MTPETIKTGDELIEKFYDEIKYALTDNDRAVRNAARQCAIIAVEEVITALAKPNPNYAENTYWHPIDSWNEVLNYLKSKL